MKRLSLEFDLRHFRVEDLDADGVALAVDLGMNLQPLLRRRSGNEVDDHLQTG